MEHGSQVKTHENHNLLNAFTSILFLMLRCGSVGNDEENDFICHKNVTKYIAFRRLHISITSLESLGDLSNYRQW